MPRVPFIPQPVPPDNAFRDMLARREFEGLKAVYIKRKQAENAAMQRFLDMTRKEREQQAELIQQAQEQEL